MRINDATLRGYGKRREEHRKSIVSFGRIRDTIRACYYPSKHVLYSITNFSQQIALDLNLWN